MQHGEFRGNSRGIPREFDVKKGNSGLKRPVECGKREGFKPRSAVRRAPEFPYYNTNRGETYVFLEFYFSACLHGRRLQYAVAQIGRARGRQAVLEFYMLHPAAVVCRATSTSIRNCYRGGAVDMRMRAPAKTEIFVSIFFSFTVLVSTRRNFRKRFCARVARNALLKAELTRAMLRMEVSTL